MVLMTCNQILACLPGRAVGLDLEPLTSAVSSLQTSGLSAGFLLFAAKISAGFMCFRLPSLHFDSLKILIMFSCFPV